MSDGECINCGESGNWCRCDEEVDQESVDTRFVAHLCDDDNRLLTYCGEPWQEWQAKEQGIGYEIQSSGGFLLLRGELPVPHMDRVRFCRACQLKGLKLLV